MTVSGTADAPVKLKDELTESDCFVHIYPHAYAWLEEKPSR